MFSKLLVRSDCKFRAQANCLAQTLRQTNINDMVTLQNAPRIIGRHICGVDIYQLVAELNRLSTLPEEKPVKKTRKRKPKQKTVKETEIKMEDNKQ